MTLAPGTTVGRYQILEPLGQGGMATVYKAFQPSLEREVALKVLRPGFAQDAEFRERFEREAKAIAKLRQPHIVQVFDFEITPSGEYVLAMEYLEGGTLKERLTTLAAQGRALDPKESVRIIAEVAEALTYAHEKGIVHRDVKPSNVMLTQKDWAVVTDFGIARILGATSHTQTGVGIGTPEYMAPEQGQGGRVDHRADIYSLGAMAYELLVGRVPYSADTPLAVVIAHIKDPLPLPSKANPAIGPATERTLLRALAKDPAQRYDSALAFADALRSGVSEDAGGVTMPTIVVGSSRAATAAAARSGSDPAAALRELSGHKRVIIAVSAVAVLALLAGGLVAGTPSRTAPDAISTARVEPTASIPAAPATAAVIATASTTSSPGTPATTAVATTAVAAVTTLSPAATIAPTAAATPASTVAPTQAPTLAPTAPPPTAAPTPALTPTPPKFAIPAKGTLFFEAALNGTDSDLNSGSGTAWPRGDGGDCAGCPPGKVSFAPGEISMTLTNGGRARVDFNVSNRLTYVGEVDLVAAAGTNNLRIQWYLRHDNRSPSSTYQVEIDVGKREGRLLYSTQSGASVLAGPFSVAPAGTGRVFTIAATVEQSRMTLYIDQRQVAQVTDTRLSVNLSPPYTVWLFGTSGTVKIVGARFYELP